jgi:hypothetical protein
LLKELGDNRVFQVEILRVSGRHHLTSESGLAALTGAKQSNDRVPSQRFTETSKIVIPSYHC